MGIKSQSKCISICSHVVVELELNQRKTLVKGILTAGWIEHDKKIKLRTDNGTDLVIENYKHISLIQ